MKHNSSVAPEEIEKFSRIADEWWDPTGKFRPLHVINPLRLEFIRSHAGRSGVKSQPLAGLSLIDIGCGGGLLTEPLARMGATVTGIDASARNIAVASLHAEKSGVTVTYRESTAETEAATGVQYDIVTALEILEHVADVDRFMIATCALVKPGGLLFLSTLNRTLKSFALAIVGAEYVLRWLPRGTHSYEKFLTPAEVAEHLRRNGMELVEQKGMVMNPLNRAWRLSDDDLSVNYLLVARKPG